MAMKQKQRRGLRPALLVACILALLNDKHVAAFSPQSSSFVTRRNYSSYVATLRRIDAHSKRHQHGTDTRLHASTDERDEIFNGRRTVALIGGQTLLVAAAGIAAVIVGTPNFGLGPGIEFSPSALQLGTLFAVPLGALAAALDLIEDQVPELQDVTKATQKSVLALMGGTFKPVLALLTAIVLGLSAGFGEEMLFRGVFQYELANRVGTFAGVMASSIVFGLLHAVTPLYAVLAGVASLYFGALYFFTDNLAVPIACHAVYDVGALFYAHWTVCQLSLAELKALAAWEGPDSDRTLL